MEKNNNNNLSNSLVFGRWPQTIRRYSHILDSDPLVVRQDGAGAHRVEVQLGLDVTQQLEEVFNFVSFGRRVVVRRVGKTGSLDLETSFKRVTFSNNNTHYGGCIALK